MHIDDLFIVITRQLLKMNDQVFAEVKAELAELFQNYELELPQKVNAFSVGATDSQKNLLGYWAWIQDLRSSGFLHSSLSEVHSAQDLPPYVKAAFENSVLKILNLSSKEKAYSYFPVTHYSRQTWIAGTELETLIDAQFSDEQQKNSLWQTVLTTDVKRFGSYSEATTIDEARNFLRVDYESYFSPANDILRTVQHFCAKNGVQFTIPQEFAQKLEQQPEDHGNFGYHYNPYPHEVLTGADIVSLVDAQKNEEIWRNVLQGILWLKEEQSDAFRKLNENMNFSDLRELFQKLTAEQALALPQGNITAALGQDFVVPESLKSKFTIPEKPPIPDGELWRAKEDPEPWQMICFEFAGEGQPSFDVRVKDVNWSEVLDGFTKALVTAEVFSKKVDTPFTEAFSLAQWVLKSKTLPLNDPMEYLEAARQAGFSDRTLSILEGRINFSLNKTLRLSDDYTRTSLALDLANVFGGMGSWTDQGFSDPKVQSEYESVSAVLYDNVKKVQYALSV